ncbi:hypothetical protein [Jiella pelagia]|uniref:Uncharacterized protein n=1 Tax=Jiella pelagia TaxID=2986949 RepID=A0ABY7BX20_9HYPH|nr:hypothetical protein [Jiella pelagia]WAP67506.1 hypothetical protein OH818_18580 [Jiella pelagia]
MRFVTELAKDLAFTLYMFVAIVCAFIAFNLMADRGFSTVACLSGAAATIALFGCFHVIARRR